MGVDVSIPVGVGVSVAVDVGVWVDVGLGVLVGVDEATVSVPCFNVVGTLPSLRSLWVNVNGVLLPSSPTAWKVICTNSPPVDTGWDPARPIRIKPEVLRLLANDQSGIRVPCSTMVAEITVGS